MPPFVKSPAALIERFDAIVAALDGVERRKMFGYPALFVGGNLVTGLFAEQWMIRLPDADREALLAVGGAEPFSPMPGRTMKGYAVLPREVVADDRALREWVDRAIAFGRTLPPK